MSFGSMILWRFTKQGGVFRFGYVCGSNGNMIEIGPYNGAVNGVWVKESEIEHEPYKR